MILNSVRPPSGRGLSYSNGNVAVGDSAFPVTDHLLQIGEYVTNDPQVNFTQLVINHNGQGASGIQLNTDVTNEVVNILNINGSASLNAKNNIDLIAGLTGAIQFIAGDEVLLLRLQPDGKVGIGRIPTEAFHVQQSSMFESSVTIKGEAIHTNNIIIDGNGRFLRVKDDEFDSSIHLEPESGISFFKYIGTSTTDFTPGFIRGSTLKLYASNSGIDINNSGNVGINQSNPTAKLHVNGSVRLDSQTITASAATPSTHKLAININGTTYYLLASNV